MVPKLPKKIWKKSFSLKFLKLWIFFVYDRITSSFVCTLTKIHPSYCFFAKYFHCKWFPMKKNYMSKANHRGILITSRRNIFEQFTNLFPKFKPNKIFRLAVVVVSVHRKIAPVYKYLRNEMKINKNYFLFHFLRIFNWISLVDDVQKLEQIPISPETFLVLPTDAST